MYYFTATDFETLWRSVVGVWYHCMPQISWLCIIELFKIVIFKPTCTHLNYHLVYVTTYVGKHVKLDLCQLENQIPLQTSDYISASAWMSEKQAYWILSPSLPSF